MDRNRKSSKPLMEKRRRARINQCLAELKNLVVDSNRKENTRYNKLEKADILEMAVKHLQLLHKQKATGNSINKFRAGFTECVHKVSTCMDRLDGLNSDIKPRLITHLTACLDNIRLSASLQQLERQSSSSSSIFGVDSSSSPDAFATSSSDHCSLPLVASRLPTGELALILPNNGTVPFMRANIHCRIVEEADNQPQDDEPKIVNNKDVWRPW